jgi:hypothetical protein
MSFEISKKVRVTVDMGIHEDIMIELTNEDLNYLALQKAREMYDENRVSVEVIGTYLSHEDYG